QIRHRQRNPFFPLAFLPASVHQLSTIIPQLFSLITDHQSLITNHRSLVSLPSARGIHKRAEIRSDKKRKDKNGTPGLSAIIEGKDYELIRRNESRYRGRDELGRVNRGRHGPRIAKAEPAAESASVFFSANRRSDLLGPAPFDLSALPDSRDPPLAARRSSYVSEAIRVP